ncbi:hypothetical protein CU254_37125 [Amycolatopsis sp. AA4]|uniref:hypothetical protein n=1 Tax=Actinomycetes TaxID=1760 RepID=UPI0001B535B0|nr:MULTISPECIES: hypothetical protein [Actinomycetes]ATY15392.1 hypothetical protein CU254_37125 [Amycolatopsis sp. AA4]EFL11642.1 predicted protein [Streptomyces sp. AA4]
MHAAPSDADAIPRSGRFLCGSPEFGDFQHFRTDGRAKAGPDPLSALEAARTEFFAKMSELTGKGYAPELRMLSGQQ